MEEWERFAEWIIGELRLEWARDGAVGPTWWMLSGGRAFRFVIPVEGDKDLLASIGKLVLKDMGATIAAFSDEAWILEKVGSEEEIKRRSEEGLEHAPGRRECVIVSVDDGMHQRLCTMMVEEETRVLGEPSWAYDSIGGRMGRLLGGLH